MDYYKKYLKYKIKYEKLKIQNGSSMQSTVIDWNYKDENGNNWVHILFKNNKNIDLFLNNYMGHEDILFDFNYKDEIPIFLLNYNHIYYDRVLEIMSKYIDTKKLDEITEKKISSRPVYDYIDSFCKMGKGLFDDNIYDLLHPWTIPYEAYTYNSFIVDYYLWRTNLFTNCAPERIYITDDTPAKSELLQAVKDCIITMNTTFPVSVNVGWAKNETLGYHSCILIIDPTKKTITIYDPNGNNASYNIPLIVNKLIDPIIKQLNDKYKSDWINTSKWKYDPTLTTTKHPINKGLQTLIPSILSISLTGSCVLWASLQAELVLKFPEHTDNIDAQIKEYMKDNNANIVHILCGYFWYLNYKVKCILFCDELFTGYDLLTKMINTPDLIDITKQKRFWIKKDTTKIKDKIIKYLDSIVINKYRVRLPIETVETVMYDNITNKNKDWKKYNYNLLYTLYAKFISTNKEFSTDIVFKKESRYINKFTHTMHKELVDYFINYWNQDELIKLKNAAKQKYDKETNSSLILLIKGIIKYMLKKYLNYLQFMLLYHPKSEEEDTKLKILYNLIIKESAMLDRRTYMPTKYEVIFKSKDYQSAYEQLKSIVEKRLV